MKPLLLALAVLGVLGVVVVLWVRLAPSDIARWHTSPGPDHLIPDADLSSTPTLAIGEGSARASLLLPLSPASALTRLDQVALASPRTLRLAGSPGEGRITWVTRSAVWGFPDYTTAIATPTQGGTRLDIFARLRFGRSDLGVNGARLAKWLAQITP
jgi:hypothetical protein